MLLMSFYFIEAQGYNFSTNISLVSKIGPLNDAGTARTMGTLAIRWDILGHDPLVSRGRIFYLNLKYLRQSHF